MGVLVHIFHTVIFQCAFLSQWFQVTCLQGHWFTTMTLKICPLILLQSFWCLAFRFNLFLVSIPIKLLSSSWMLPIFHVIILILLITVIFIIPAACPIWSCFWWLFVPSACTLFCLSPCFVYYLSLLQKGQIPTGLNGPQVSSHTVWVSCYLAQLKTALVAHCNYSVTGSLFHGDLLWKLCHSICSSNRPEGCST